MKRIFPASLMIAATMACASAYAQTAPQPATAAAVTAMPPPSAAAGDNKDALNERFTECVNNVNCSAQIRLQIIQEEADAMNDHFQKIHQVCADENFQDCTRKQSEDIQAWFSAENNAQELMRSLQGADSMAQSQDLSAKEPAAGCPTAAVPVSADTTRKSFWQKIWPFSDNK